jgi:hypothetical protein
MSPGAHVPGAHVPGARCPCARCQEPMCHVAMGIWDLGVGVDLSRGVACGWRLVARKGNTQTSGFA